MKEELSVIEILKKIDEAAAHSTVLKGKTATKEWTINELIYCLDLIQTKNELNFSIQIPEQNMSIPTGICIPIWVDSKTRAKKVKIIDIEVDEIPCDTGDDYEYHEEIDYFYHVIVEEV